MKNVWRASSSSKNYQGITMPITINGGSIRNCGTAISVSGDIDLQMTGLLIDNCGRAIVHTESGRKVDLVELIQNRIFSNDKDELIELLEHIKGSSNRGEVHAAYERFVSLAANHMTILAPFLPSLAAFVSAIN